MKRVMLFLVFLLTVLNVKAYEYQTQPPLPGSSICNNQLQYDLLVPVYGFSRFLSSKDCTVFNITDTKLLKKMSIDKTTVSGIKYGIWEEIWTVKACADNITFKIRFTEDLTNKTGTSYVIYEVAKNGVLVNKKQ